MGDQQRHDGWPAAAVAFVGAFAIYAVTAAPAPTWLDSPELVAAGATLGVAHSPGHPLAGLLGRLATLVPVADVATRIALLSAVAGAIAAAVMVMGARRAMTGATPELAPWARDALALGAALGYALCWAAWFQAVRAEVYALQGALLAGVLAAAIDWHGTGDARALRLAGLLGGLALAHHHLMAILLLLPTSGFVLARARARRPTARLASMTALCGLLGLAALAYLPVRAARDPLVNWGDPDTWSRLAWTIQAKAFQKTAAAEHVSSPGEDAVQIVAALLEHATPIGAVALLLGLYLGLRRRGARGLVALLVAVAGLAVVGRAAIGFDPDTPDHHGYLLPAVASAALLGALGLARGAVAVGQAVGTRAARRAGAVVACALAAAPAAWHLALTADAASLRGAYAADVMARAELEPLPPRALLLTAYFQTRFRLWALQAVEHARPDVAILDRSFLTYPGFPALARARYPELSPLIDAPLRAGAPTPVAELTARAARRPVLMELHINVDAAAERYLVPEGSIYARFTATEVTAARRAAGEARDHEALAALTAAMTTTVPADDAGRRDALLWLAFVRARFYCAVGRADAARNAVITGLDLAPDDLLLSAMAEGCPRPP